MKSTPVGRSGIMVPVFAWAICQPLPQSGNVDVLISTIKSTKKYAIKSFLNQKWNGPEPNTPFPSNKYAWKFYYRRGYRCKRIMVKEFGI